MKPFILDIERNLINAFNHVDLWFDEPESCRSYKPINGGWSINEILEHISLTNHYLLILIEKGFRKSLKNVQNNILKSEIDKYLAITNLKLDEVAIHSKFTWIRPTHMEPQGNKSSVSIKNLIRLQCDKCAYYLQKMPNGEGVLHKTTMTVNDLGKINVYDYIKFLINHAERHITQMENSKTEFFLRIT